MKISELKNKFISDSEILARSFGYSLKSPNLGTHIVTVYFPQGTSWFKRTDLYLFEHIVIKVNENFSRYCSFDEKEKEFIEKQFRLLDEYWKAYTELKESEGYIFISDTSNDFLELLSIATKNNMLESEILHLQNEAKYKLVDSPKYIGGRIGKSYAESIELFQNALHVLDSAIKENPLFVLEKQSQNNIHSLFHAGMLSVSCYGDNFHIYLNSGFKSIRFTYYFSAMEKEDFNVPLDVFSINEAIKKIKEENKMLTLIHPPKVGFKKLLKEMFYIENHKLIEEGYESLLGILGNWESVETECIYMMQHSKKVKIHEISDGATRKNVTVHKLNGQEKSFFFINYTVNVVKENLKIHATEGERMPEHVQKELFDFIFDTDVSN